MNDEQKDLRSQGQENVHRGRRHQTAGWFQKVVAKITENREKQAKGGAQEVGGKIQSKMGEVEQKVDQASEHS